MSELYDEAVAAVEAGDEERARRLLLEVIEAEPENADAWLGLASVLEGERRREALERVLELDPENKRARQQLGYGTEDAQELPTFEPEAEPPVEAAADEAGPEPVPPAVTSPVGAEADADPLPEPVPPSEGAVSPALPGMAAATSVTGVPETAAKMPPPPPASDSTDAVAMIIEIVYGFFGALGIGWLYAGNYAVGALAFLGYLVLLALEVVGAVLSGGLALCLFVPLNIAIFAFSGVKVRQYVQRVNAQGKILFPILALLVPVLLVCGLLVVMLLVAPAVGVTFEEIQRGLEATLVP